MLTYRELKNQLDKLTNSQLNDTVTVYMLPEDEFYPVSNSVTSIGDDILHDNHFYLSVKLDV